MENKENNENKEESKQNEEKCMKKSNSVCVNHVSLRDFILFREEFLKYLGEFKKEVATNFSKEQKKYDNFIDQTSSVILSQINSNNFVSKLSFIEEKNEIISYIKKIETNIINQIMINKINLTSCKKDLSDACFKYDKIISENLFISGLIGVSCPFSNLKEYLLNNKDEIANNILDIKKNSIEIKEYKNRVESIYEQLKFQINNIRGTLQAYTELKIKEINDKCDNFITKVDDKLSSLNIQNSQLIAELRDKEEKIEKSENFIEKIKEEVVENNANSINTITKNNNKVLHQLTQAKNEFKSMKKNIVDLSMLLTKKDNDKNKKNKDKIIKNFNDMMTDLIKETFINEKKNELNYNITNNNFPNANLPNKDNNNTIKTEKENESANITNNSNKLNQNLKLKEDEEENKKSQKLKLGDSKIKLKFPKDIEKRSNKNIDNKNDEEIDFDRILKKLAFNGGRNPSLIEEKKSEENIKNINKINEDKKLEEDSKSINKEEDVEEEEKKIVKSLEKVKNIDYQIISKKTKKKRNNSKNKNDDSSESKNGNESYTKSNKSENKNEISESKNKQKKNIKNMDDEKDKEKSNEEINIESNEIVKKKNKNNNKLIIMSHPAEVNKTISNEKKNGINNDNIYYKTFSNFNSFKFEKNPKKIEKSNTLLNQNKMINYKNHIKIIKDNNLKIFEQNKYHNSKINNLLTLDNDKPNKSIRKEYLPIKKNIFSMYDYLRSSRDQSNYKINKTEKKDLNNSKVKESKNRIKSKDMEEISNKTILKKIAFIRDDQIIDKPLLCNQENFEVSRSAGDMEKKLLHLEFFVKKKFDELVKEIKIFIPIHFNSYTRDYNIIFK